MASQPFRQQDSAQIGEGISAPRRRSKKRETIIEAAKIVFFEDGYNGASMDRITAQAGVSKATIYAHFSSKEEVLRAVVDAVIEPIASNYIAAVRKIERFEEGLFSLGHLIARNAMLPDVIALERLVTAEALRFPELGALYMRHAVNSAFTLFRPQFEAAMDAGLLRRDDPMVVLQRFAQWCCTDVRQAVMLNQRPMPDDEEIARLAEDGVRAFLLGYSPRR